MDKVAKKASFISNFFVSAVPGEKSRADAWKALNCVTAPFPSLKMHCGVWYILRNLKERQFHRLNVQVLNGEGALNAESTPLPTHPTPPSNQFCAFQTLIRKGSDCWCPTCWRSYSSSFKNWWWHRQLKLSRLAQPLQPKKWDGNLSRSTFRYLLTPQKTRVYIFPYQVINRSSHFHVGLRYEGAEAKGAAQWWSLRGLQWSCQSISIVLTWLSTTVSFCVTDRC